MSIRKFCKWTTQEFKLSHSYPTENLQSDAGADTFVRDGTWKGRPVRHYKHTSDTREVYFVPHYRDNNGLRVFSHDGSLLETYFELEYGKILWK